MADSQQVQEQTQATEQQNTGPDDLEQVLDKYGTVDQEAAKFSPSPAPAPAPAPAPVAVPDPYDAEAFKAYLGQINSGQNDLRQAVQSVVGALNAQSQAQALQQLEADISKAAKAVDEKSGIGNVHLAQFELEQMARQDPRFKAIWQNRVKNPQALDKAIDGISKRIASKYEIKTDPRLVDAHRAVKLSQQQSATSAQPESDMEVPSDPREFEAFWQSLKGY